MDLTEAVETLRRTADLLEGNPELAELGGISQIHTPDYAFLGYPGERLGEFLQYLDFRGIEFFAYPENSSVVIQVAGIQFWVSQTRLGANEEAMAILGRAHDLTHLLNLPTPKSTP